MAKASDIFNRFGSSTNGSHFDHTGTLVFAGTATVWDDLRVALYSRSGGTAPTYTSGFAGNATLYAWNFGSGTHNLYFEVQMPHGWRGTTLYPHVHWSPTTTSTGNVRWYFEYTWVDINGTFGTSSTLTIDSPVVTDSRWKHLLSGGEIIPSATQKGLSTMMLCRLYRTGGGTGDTFPDNAALVAFDIHYEIDTIGSRNEIVK